MTDPVTTSRCDEDRLANELAAKAAAGSLASFDHLVALLGPRLLRYLVGRLGDTHAAEDALQEALLKAYCNLGRYDASRSVSAWLFAIATREAVGYWRSRKAAVPLELVDPPDNSASPVLEAMIEQEQREGIWAAALAALDAEQYGALWMRYVEGLAVREIADALGRSANSVSVMLHRACRRLMNSPAAALAPPRGPERVPPAGMLSIETSRGAR
jgi:RNA polymerase sigma-70 factor (ECF subfamily)